MIRRRFSLPASIPARSAEDSFDHFEEQRELNLEYLRELPSGATNRTGIHPEFGPLTVSHVLNEWAFHDIGHIKQIAEIIRALKYYPNMGPFQSAYQINP